MPVLRSDTKKRPKTRNQPPDTGKENKSCCLCPPDIRCPEIFDNHLLGPCKPNSVMDPPALFSHQDCASWSFHSHADYSDPQFSDHLTRTWRKIQQYKCKHCESSGAFIKCAISLCKFRYHYTCLRNIGGLFNHTLYSALCPRHSRKNTDPKFVHISSKTSYLVSQHDAIQGSKECAFCPTIYSNKGTLLGPFQEFPGSQSKVYVHPGCKTWIFSQTKILLDVPPNLGVILHVSRRRTCCICHMKGAAMVCSIENGVCKNFFHFSCLLLSETGKINELSKTASCPFHNLRISPINSSVGFSTLSLSKGLCKEYGFENVHSPLNKNVQHIPIDKARTNHLFKCILCPPENQSQGSKDEFLGPFSLDVKYNGAVKDSIYVHKECALWNPWVLYDATSKNFENISKAIILTLSPPITCAGCLSKGAFVPCCASTCTRRFHYSCIENSRGYLDRNKFHVLCNSHYKMKQSGVKLDLVPHCRVEKLCLLCPSKSARDNQADMKVIEFLSSKRGYFYGHLACIRKNSEIEFSKTEQVYKIPIKSQLYLRLMAKSQSRSNNNTQVTKPEVKPRGSTVCHIKQGKSQVLVCAATPLKHSLNAVCRSLSDLQKDRINVAKHSEPESQCQVAEILKYFDFVKMMLEKLCKIIVRNTNTEREYKKTNKYGKIRKKPTLACEHGQTDVMKEKQPKGKRKNSNNHVVAETKTNHKSRKVSHPSNDHPEPIHSETPLPVKLNEINPQTIIDSECNASDGVNSMVEQNLPQDKDPKMLLESKISFLRKDSLGESNNNVNDISKSFETRKANMALKKALERKRNFFASMSLQRPSSDLKLGVNGSLGGSDMERNVVTPSEQAHIPNKSRNPDKSAGRKTKVTNSSSVVPEDDVDLDKIFISFD